MNKQDKDALTDFLMTVAFIALVIFVVKARDAQRARADTDKVPAIEQTEAADAD